MSERPPIKNEYTLAAWKEGKIVDSASIWAESLTAAIEDFLRTSKAGLAGGEPVDIEIDELNESIRDECDVIGAGHETGRDA